MANSDLADSRIRNFRRMELRTIIMALGVSADTSPDVLEEIPAIVEGIINSIEDAKCNRIHLKEIGDYAYNYEALYTVYTTDYVRYMEIRQAVNMGIIKEFAARNIVMPYPTSAVLTVNKKN